MTYELTNSENRAFSAESKWLTPSRNPEWRSAKKLLQGFDEGLKEAELDYVDLWRITCHEQGGDHSFNESAEITLALDVSAGKNHR